MTTPAIPQSGAVLPSPLQAEIAAARASPEGSQLEDAGLLDVAMQIQHNLQYQHAWTDVRLHLRSPLTDAPLPRPLLSGLPSQRLYVHPDEQIELLKKADRARKAAATKEGEPAKPLDVTVAPEREWVLPTRLCEKWTLRRLSDLFDALTVLPPGPESDGHGDQANNPWRTTKRLVLASADPDSTVVYYIVHDGLVKPRQN